MNTMRIRCEYSISDKGELPATFGAKISNMRLRGALLTRIRGRRRMPCIKSATTEIYLLARPVPITANRRKWPIIFVDLWRTRTKFFWYLTAN